MDSPGRDMARDVPRDAPLQVHERTLRTRTRPPPRARASEDQCGCGERRAIGWGSHVTPIATLWRRRHRPARRAQAVAPLQHGRPGGVGNTPAVRDHRHIRECSGPRVAPIRASRERRRAESTADALSERGLHATRAACAACGKGPGGGDTASPSPQRSKPRSTRCGQIRCVSPRHSELPARCSRCRDNGRGSGRTFRRCRSLRRL